MKKGSRFLLLLFLTRLAFAEENALPSSHEEETPNDDILCPLSLRITNTSAHAVNIAWNFPCHDPATVYKLTYAHLEWIACPYGTRSQEDSSGRGFIRTAEREFTLQGLLPYSRYRITVKALPGEKELPVVEEFLVAETASSPPEVAFGQSVIPTDLSKDSLKFYWRDPLTSLCKEFHGDILHGRYIFKGEDPWNLHDEREGIMSIKENSKEFEDLLPFSHYSFSLYALNTENMLSPEALVLKARTLPSVPPPPVHLEVLDSSSEDSVPLRWQPGYPPTGEALRYVVKWKISEARNWLSSLSIPSSMAKDMCDENYYYLHCYSITELNKSRNLTFIITAYNEGVEENSKWSEEARFKANQTMEEVFPIDKAGLGSGGSLAIWEILLIVIFTLVALTLILGIFWIKCCQNPDRRKYLSVPIYHLSKGHKEGGANARPGSNLSSPFMRELSKSIQNVPLPPVPGGEHHVYEELPAKAPLTSVSSKELAYDEEMYLRPNKLANAKSVDSLDDSEYLVPTFPVVIDTSNVPTTNAHDNSDGDTRRTPSSPIPIRSYEQKSLNKS